MGLLLSCCGQRKKEKKYSPLLDRDEQEPLGPSRDVLVKAAAAFGALSAGKLPTEGQLEHVLRSCLHSTILNDKDAIGGRGPLSQNGRKLLADTREVIEAVLQVGMEKNCWLSANAVLRHSPDVLQTTTCSRNSTLVITNWLPVRANWSPTQRSTLMSNHLH
jgi:hypothetical protein